jgi:hypothetical protein
MAPPVHRPSFQEIPMNDLGQLLRQLPPAVTNVLQQVQAGNHDAVSNEDANTAFSHVTSQLSPDEFQQVAADAYQRLSPTQRSEVADYLRKQTQQQGTTVATTLPSPSAAASDPGALANATAQIQAQQPNLLQQLFAPGGAFSSPIAKAAVLGITAMAAQRIAGKR